jgi:drug/metabolite transporter (DMT)-like permease
MPVEIILLLLFAATMHAVWNGMIKGAGDGVVMASWIYCGSGALLAPALFFLPALPPRGWALLAAHFALHMVYKVLLINMYRLGDFSRVFPVARGSAPAIVTLAAIPAAGELPPPAALAGVGVVCIGLISFAAEPGALQRASRNVLLLAAAAGGIVSAYTLVDALGVRLPGTGLSYFVWLFAGDALGMALLGLWWRGRGLWPAMAGCWRGGVPAALMSIANFGIVLWVMTFNPIGPVAAVRETSIVIAALIGAAFFRESFGPRRIVAACVILAGIVLLNLPA